MEINDSLLQRFFRKECTPAEADFVAGYLRDNPGAMERYFSQHEFDDTEALETEDYQEEEQWDALQRKLKVRRLGRGIGRLAIAASLVGVIATFAFLFNRNNSEKQFAGNDQSAAQPATAGWTTIANSSDQDKSYTLKDGSTVKLSVGASIRFNDNGWQARRDIDLTGEAVFYVAKDKTRPFSVYCNEVSVRALGTIFAVRQQQGADSMRVRLFEGKVLVRKQHEPRGRDSVDLIEPVTLKPGEEMLFAANRDIAYKHTFLTTAPKPTVATTKQVTIKSEVGKPGWVEFNNQPLNDLFGSLEVLYNVEIEFKQQDVHDIYFMGRFEAYDTIDGILEIIGRLNGLTIKKKAAGKYRVTK